MMLRLPRQVRRCEDAVVPQAPSAYMRTPRPGLAFDRVSPKVIRHGKIFEKPCSGFSSCLHNALTASKEGPAAQTDAERDRALAT